MGEDPHKPLRDDVRLLGKLLGEAPRTLGKPGVYEPVERGRALATSGRAGREDDFAALQRGSAACRWRAPARIS